MSRFSVTSPLSFSHPTQMPFGQGLGMLQGMEPFADGMPDLFVRMAPPERGCFVESGDEAGGGGGTVKAGPKRRGMPGAKSASTGERVGKAGRQDRSVGGSGPETEKYFPYRSLDEFFSIVGSRAESFPQQVSDRTIKCLPWILDQKPDRETVERVLRLILPENHAIRDQFAKDWLDLGSITGQVRRDFESYVNTLPRVPEHTDPAAFGLQFPQELWKDYRAWWADLARQAKSFVKDYWQPQNNLSDVEAQAKIKELLEMEKANYEKLLPLKAKAHEAIRDSLVLIPGGMFMVGSYSLLGDEKPAHPVWVSSFLMMDEPVTNAMWFAVMGTDLLQRYERVGRMSFSDDQPVVEVFWSEASKFARYVGCALPSEAQWERAAYGSLASYPYASERWSVNPNPFGLYNMCGKLWQWLRWIQDSERSYKTTAQINPRSLESYGYISRNGPWNNKDLAVRRSYAAINNSYDIGFRCARSPSQDSK